MDDLKKRKSDSILKLALEEEMLQDADLLKYMSDDEKENPHEFSERHNRRMKKLYKMADKVEHRAAYRRRNFQIAAGMAVFLCVSVVAVTQVEAFRLPILQFFMDIKEKSTHLGIHKENQLKLADHFCDYEPDYTPEGYVVVSLEQDESGFSIRYESEGGQSWYNYHYSRVMGNLNIDSENGDISEEIINGTPAVVIQKDDEIRIIIDIGAHRFCLEGVLPIEEAKKVMNSIKY